MNKTNTRKENMNRLLFERSDTLNGINTRDIGRNIYKHRSKNVGEITGANLNISEFERGLPMRESISIVKRDEALDMNQRFDFNDEEEARSLDIEYNDPDLDKQKFNFVDEEPEKVNTTEICHNNFNFFCLNLFNLLQHYMKSGYCISPLLCYLIYIGLYMTEISGNLDEIFSFPDKNIMFDGTSKIIVDIKKYISKCTLFVDKNYKLNREYVDYISDFVNVRRIMDPINIGYGEMNFYFIPKFGFHKRNTIIKNKIEIMRQLNVVADYYEDSNSSLFELVNESEDLSLGILLTKETINIEYFNYMTNSLKTFEFKEVHIPKINQINKYTFSSIMKRIIPDNLFNTFLINNTMKLNDIRQSISFVLEETGNKIRKQNVKTDRKYIAPEKFIYYIRNIEFNVILLIGFFR